MTKETDKKAQSALVVDDGAVERLAGKTMLERMGFSVITASSGEDALRLLSERGADIVLCDISMPGMDGLVLLEATRNAPNAPPFIMSTTHNDAEHAVAALRRGAYGYLTKPLRFDTLQQTVNETIEKYHADQVSAQQAKQQTQVDGLTGLINREEFNRRLRERLLGSPAGEDCGALLLFKISGLNHVNHSYGRSAGDKVLKATAEILNGLVRPADILSRFGGDVFAAYLDCVDYQQIEERAASVTAKVEDARIVLAGEPFNPSIMVGGCCAYGSMEVEDLFNRADFALHLVRARGRSRIRIYSEADEVHKRELAQQLNMLAVVRAALTDARRIAMYYQPIVHLEDGTVSHYEALLRLFDETGKPCNTGEMIKTAEVFGLIGQLDKAVIDACLSDVERLPDGAAMAINLSGKSIGDPRLLEHIENRIAELGIDPSRIVFELTETAAFYNLDEVRDFVRRIKALGCRFALDDFGVGFSSFYYIKEFSFDYLKLDGSFIKALPTSPTDQVFVRAMVEISKVFGMTVIAEWVEDKQTADLLRSFGVALGQGYHFGKPSPLSQA